MEKEAEKLYSQYESSKNQPGHDDAIVYAGPQEMSDALESLVSVASRDGLLFYIHLYIHKKKEAQKKALELMMTNEHYVKHLNQQHKDVRW
jgi:hypothetical protein